MDKVTLEDGAASVEKIEPDFVHKDGSLVFLNPSIAIRYYQRLLDDVTNRFELLDPHPVPFSAEAETRAHTVRNLQEEQADLLAKKNRYHRMFDASEYNYLVDLLAIAETEDEAWALNMEFLRYATQKQDLLKREELYFRRAHEEKTKQLRDGKEA